MSIIGEAFLTASVDLLVKKLASEGVLFFARQKEIEADLMRWANMLEMIKAVLDDAAEKKTTNQFVKKWLGKLQNLAYDVEDLLDEFQTEAFRRRLLLGNGEPAAAHDQPSSSRTTTSEFRKLILTCSTTFTLQSIQFDFTLMSKIKRINDRFQEILTEKDLLDLEESSAGLGRTTKNRQRQETTSLVNEAEIYGRETEKKEIAELLLRDDLRNDGRFLVIPIVGLGGLGKTTLARLGYNDDRVQNHFDLKAWICVADDFDVTKLTKTILTSIVAHQNVDNLNLNKLQEELKKQLLGKKFLLVLDDVWNRNYDDWVEFSLPFGASARGSKIIVTTRDEEVAKIMGTLPAYELKKLSDNDCLAVFAQHSLGTRDFSSHMSLEEIGKKIVTKCDGLPLAAQALGGLLRGERDRGEWERVLSSKIWELQEEGCRIIPALAVSYYYLRPTLKQCFAYCSLLPKDYEFEEEEIILLWCASGFLDQKEREKTGEDLGRKFFKELRSRSFFQQSSNNKSRFVMHDLISDLAQWAAEEIYFTMEYTSEVNKQQSFSENLRHLSYIRGDYDGVKRFEDLYDIQHLRTFLPVMLSNSSLSGYLSPSILPKLLKLQRLRVFSLRGYCIPELPDSIGDLRYLRYLNLSGTEIRTLPESVNKLYNLHALLLEDCRRLEKLCADMGNLAKLHHLKNSNTKSLEEMPVGIGRLTCLQTLCNFVVGKGSGSGLRELKLLTHLHGTLNISKLENVKCVGDAMEAQMDGKKNLKVLSLKWTCSTDGSSSREAETEEGVLDMLKPHTNLEQFCIKGYGGMKFPTWLGDSSFSNLVTLKFENCDMCTALPSVGQLPSLKHLVVCGMSSVRRLDPEFYGKGASIPFPCLETLRFEDMEEWEDWIPHGSGQGVEGFPTLRELHILGCAKLQGTFPEHLPALEMLVIEGCEELSISITSLPALCKFEIGGCKKVVWRSATGHLGSQNSVVCRDASNQVFLAGPLKLRLPKLEELEINDMKEQTYIWKSHNGLLQDISSLKRLTIASCPKLQSLVAEEEKDQQQQLCELSSRLEYLRLSYCEGLVKLPQSSLSLSSLREIEIYGCRSLVSFPEVALPSKLKKIEISSCDALKSLPEAWMCDTNSSLEILEISGCDSLTYIAGVQLPPSLKRLKICHCDNIRTLTVEEGIQCSSGRRYTSSLLEDLSILVCRSLTCIFSKNELPATLESLEVGNLPPSLKLLLVYGCSKLESIAEMLDNNTSLETISILCCENLKILPSGLHNLRQLQEISIEKCGNLESFPEGGLPCAKLAMLAIYNCKRLEALPKGLHNLKSLQELRIGKGVALPSLEEDGLPTNLHVLLINGNMEIWKSMIERGRGFHRFSSLRQLTIMNCDDDMVSFPPKADDKGSGTALPLPASLTYLRIEGFPNLERLTSSFVDLQNLTGLVLGGCRKLKYFPEKGLPSSLLYLRISRCPLMAEKCRKDGGQYWDLLTHIPHVEISDVEMSVDGREVREVREVQRGWRTILGLVNPYTLCSNSPTNEWVEVVD